MANEGQQLIKNMLKDIQMNLTDEFDRNFERKAFFDKSWPATKWKNDKGSLMMRSGNLRRSLLHPKLTDNSITFTSDMPYASIHNEGGTIQVTAKMKRFAWAMYYKASGAVTKTKGGKMSGSKRNVRLTQEAEQWKALALKKVGDTIKIEQRQFIGDHPRVRTIVEEAVGKNIKDLEVYFNEKFKQK